MTRVASSKRLGLGLVACALLASADARAQGGYNKCGHFISSHESGDINPIFDIVDTNYSTYKNALNIDECDWWDVTECYGKEPGGMDYHNHNSSLRRILNAYVLLGNYDGWQPDVNDAIDDTQPVPECKATMSILSNESLNGVDVYRIPHMEWEVWFRAAALVHESRHHQKGGFRHWWTCCEAASAGDNPFACDSSWSYNGGWRKGTEFLWDFMEQRPLDWAYPARLDALDLANDFVDTGFCTHPDKNKELSALYGYSGKGWYWSSSDVDFEYMPPEPLAHEGYNDQWWIVGIELQISTMDYPGSLTGARLEGMRLKLRRVDQTSDNPTTGTPKWVELGDVSDDPTVSLDATYFGARYVIKALAIGWINVDAPLDAKDRVYMSIEAEELDKDGNYTGKIGLLSHAGSDAYPLPAFATWSRTEGHVLAGLGLGASPIDGSLSLRTTKEELPRPYTRHLGKPSEEGVYIDPKQGCPAGTRAVGVLLTELEPPAISGIVLPGGLGLLCQEEQQLKAPMVVPWFLSMAHTAFAGTTVAPGVVKLFSAEGAAVYSALAGTNPQLFTCPAGYQMHGIGAKEVAGINHVSQLRCSPYPDGPKAGSSNVVVSVNVGLPLGNDRLLACPWEDGAWARGFYATASNSLDRIALYCEYPKKQ